MPASVVSPLSSTLPIQLLSFPLPSCLALWPASLTAEQACFYKAAVKRGESRYGRSWGLFRRSKILHRSVYSALWLGGLRCQCRRQTNGPLTALCPCVMVLGKKKKKKKKHSVGPFSGVGPTGKMPVCPITSPALIIIYLSINEIFKHYTFMEVPKMIICGVCGICRKALKETFSTKNLLHNGTFYGCWRFLKEP